MITFESLKNLDANEKNWYFTQYPFLKDFNFPPDVDFLQEYYFSDMRSRNLVPLESLFENYDFLFSYFLANYNKNFSDKFKAPNWFNRLLDSFPEAIKQTEKDLKPVSDVLTGVTDIVSGIGSAVKNFWFIIVPIIVLLILKELKIL